MMKFPWRGMLFALMILGCCAAVVQLFWAYLAALATPEWPSPIIEAGWWNILIWSGPVLGLFAFFTIVGDDWIRRNSK